MKHSLNNSFRRNLSQLVSNLSGFLRQLSPFINVTEPSDPVFHQEPSPVLSHQNTEQKTRISYLAHLENERQVFHLFPSYTNKRSF